jgi:hypothetical protein
MKLLVLFEQFYGGQSFINMNLVANARHAVKELGG